MYILNNSSGLHCELKQLQDRMILPDYLYNI